MLTLQAQLPTLGNISAKYDQNPIRNYREIRWKKITCLLYLPYP